MLHRLIIVAALAGLVLVVACAGTLDPSITNFEVGDCIRDSSVGFAREEVESLDRVDCSEPGTLRATRVFQITQYDDYPGDAAIDSLAESRCPSETAKLFFPTEESWNGADDREVVCFDDDDSSSDTGDTSATTVCDQRANLDQSVNDLVELDVIAGGTDSLNAAIDRVESDVDSLAAVASSEVEAEVNALNDAIELADETFSNLDDESLLAATAEVALAIADVAIAAEALVTALAVECD